MVQRAVVAVWVMSWVECQGQEVPEVGTWVCRWYQVRLGCQEFIDSGFVMSVVPRTSS